MQKKGGIQFPLFFSLILTLFFGLAQGVEIQEFPVLYKGRYRPAEAYARLWLYEIYHAPTLKSRDLSAFYTDSSSPLSLLWSLEIKGYAPYQTAPLFWIGSADLKKLIGLPLKNSHFSYEELRNAVDQKNEEILLNKNQKLKEDWSTLKMALHEFEHLYAHQSPTEIAFQHRFTELQAKSIAPKEIQWMLEQEYPFIQRLRESGSLFKSLPSRYNEGEWFSLKALKVKMYQPSLQALKEVGNFTSFSNTDFEAIRQAYFNLEKAYANTHDDQIQEAENNLAEVLLQAYRSHAGKTVKEAHGKKLTYPSLTQLKIETLYVQYPWISILILLYGIAACFSLIFYRQNGQFGGFFSIGILSLALICHTSLLIMRSYILGRPPVSNMFETVIYVPWVATCVTLLFPTFRRHPLILLAACVTSAILLVILEITDLNQSLDQVQAVLDSQFWLLIHVLLVVGSYGMFILAAIIGHFYLTLFMIHRQETTTMKKLSQAILQSLYGGTTLLIAGTILGGIWAAESWGRFWDWDPKESWAFISSCFYLICIHAYRFHHIASFGLAIGAVGGLLVISFTWYGVNYILGTGLHSYGFGSGGNLYYYAFLAAECLFLAVVVKTQRTQRTKMIG